MQRAIGTMEGAAPRDLIHEVETLFSAVFHATDEPLLITQADDGLICEINDAAVQLTGYQQDEVRWRRVTEVNLWGDMERRNELVRNAVSTGGSQEGELLLVRKSGHVRPVHGRFQSVVLRGTVYLLLVLHVLAT